MKKLVQWMKFGLLSLVLAWVFPAIAGAYEDFFDAVRHDKARVVHDLLARGFDPNTLDPGKRTGLMLAVAEPSPRVAELLIDTLRIDLDATNPAGENALMLAALKGQERLVERLIGRGAEVNKPGWTPLHYAATGGHARIVRLLIEHHAFLDAESPNGTTPLMMAAQYGSTEAVRLLLEEGALPELKNQRGLTALDFARLGSRPDAIALLTEALKQAGQAPAAPPAAPQEAPLEGPAVGPAGGPAGAPPAAAGAPAQAAPAQAAPAQGAAATEPPKGPAAGR